MNQSQFLMARQWFLKSKIVPISDEYEVDVRRVLGQSLYGQVIKSRHKESKQYYAIKLIPKNKIKSKDRFIREVSTLMNLKNNCLTYIHEVYEDLRNIYIVMELCEGDFLLEKLLQTAYLTEETYSFSYSPMSSKWHMSQKFECFKQLEDQGDSFLFSTKSDLKTLKAIDFGISMLFVDDMLKKSNGKIVKSTRPGRPYFIAPEVLTGRCGPPSDIWAAGVLLYMMLTGKPAFSGTDEEIFEKIQKMEVLYDIPEFNKVTADAIDLLKKIFQVDRNRFSSGDILRHPWILNEKPVDSHLDVDYLSLQRLIQKNQLKKVVLTFMTTQLKENEIMELKAMFTELDTDNDGVITIDDMKMAIQDLQTNWKHDLEQIINNLETNESRSINYLEFMAATLERSTYMREEKLFQVFKILDSDENGKISHKDLIQASKNYDVFKDIPQDFWQSYLEQADKNQDGEVILFSSNLARLFGVY